MDETHDFVRELKEKTPPLLWIPQGKTQINSFVARQSSMEDGLTKEQLQRVVTEAKTILGRCVNPSGEPSVSTGLVVGYVQSGKTLSFTTLTALAHDNGFGLIIIIAGTKNNLINQTLSRLSDDLNIKEDEVTDWVPLNNPSKDNLGDLLKKNLSVRNSNTTTKYRTCIVTVLKHSKRLSDLCEILAEVDMRRIPTLIIDDEADQAGLNTFNAKNLSTNSNQKSSNYSWLLELRKVLPFHSYVQYTATPQASLLQNITDKLAPEFAELVTPGSGYVGGKDFFYKNSPFIKIIPAADLLENRKDQFAIPESLIKAFSVFIYGSAVHEATGSSKIRTMMIHPAQNTGPQKKYLSWIDDLLSEWSNGLDDDLRRQAILDLISIGREELQKTFESTLPTVDEIFKSILNVIRELKIQEVNATPTGSSNFKWGQSKYWVLVGGAKLDRGFTVKNLVVTYMPRNLGDGNADSVQQRARFLGYKESYKKFCRIYVDSDVSSAFTNYVEHEDEIHNQLESTRGYPLALWRRKFFLKMMKPTRSSVIGLQMKRVDMQGWVHPDDMAINPEMCAANYDEIRKFLSQLEGPIKPQEYYPDRFIDKREDERNKHHLYEDLPIESITVLLDKLQFQSSRDDWTMTSVVSYLQRIAQSKPNEKIDLFLMRGFEPTRRSFSNKKEIQPFQGKSPNTNDTNKLNYGGDKSFYFEERLCLQLHNFNIYADKDSSIILVKNCPWVCFYIPESLKNSIIIDADG